jgi:hypothetical protein
LGRRRRGQRFTHARQQGTNRCPANAAFFRNGNEIAEMAHCHAEIVWVGCAMALDLKSM